MRAEHRRPRSTAALVLLLVAASLSAACPKDPEPAEPLIARVGPATLTRSDFEQLAATEGRAFDWELPEIDEATARLRQMALVDEWCERQLLLLEARRRHIQPAPELVRQAVTAWRRMYPPGEFLRTLATGGMDLGILRKRLAERTMIQRLFEQVAGDATVEEAEIAAYYEAHRDDFRHPDQALIDHVLLPSRRAARTFLRTLRRGTPFSVAAREQGLEGSLSADGTGEHLVNVDELAPPLAAALRRLRPKALSRPIETEEGVHLIRLWERRPAGVPSLDDLRETIRARLARQLAQKRWTDALAELRRRSPPQIFPENLPPPRITTETSSHVNSF